MNKKEFVDLFAEKGGYTKKDADKAIKLFLNLVEESLVKGESVSFIGWGKFEVVKRAARTMKNPQNGKKIKVKEKNVVKFRVGKGLSEKVK